MAYDPNLGYDPDAGGYDPNQPPQLPQEPPPANPSPAQPSFADFQRDYWAPDRDTVLKQMAPAPQTPSPQGPDLRSTIPGYNPNTGVVTPQTGYPTRAAQQAAQAPTSSFNYERARDSWMSGQYGGGEAGARAWAAANGVAYNGGDTITLPNGGGEIDIIGNFRSGRGMTNNWTPAGGNGPNPGGQGFGGGNTGVAGGGQFGGQSTYGITSDALQKQYRDVLLRMMQQGEQPVDEQSLGIRQPYEAGRLAAERQLEQAQQANAERLYAQGQLGGGGSNELTQLNQQGRERVGVGLAGLKSGLVQQEIQQRRGQLQQALQLANAVGARQEAMQLQRELAQLQNQFNYAELGQRASQFGEDLGFRRAAYIQGMNQNAFNTGYGNEGG